MLKRFTKSIFEQLCNERLLGQPKIDSLHEYLKIEQRFDLNKGNNVMMIFAHILNIHPRSIKLLMRINTNVCFLYLEGNYVDYVNRLTKHQVNVLRISFSGSSLYHD